MSKSYKLRNKVLVKGKQISCSDIIDGFLLEAEKTLTILKSNESLTEEELNKQKIIIAGESINNIQLCLFSNEKELIRFKNTMMKNLVFNYAVPMIKDELIEKSDISLIWSIGRALNNNKNIIAITYPDLLSGQLNDLLHCKTYSKVGIPQILDTLFSNSFNFYAYELAYFDTEEEEDKKTLLQKELNRGMIQGVNYMLNYFGQIHFELFIKSFLNKFQEGYYMNTFAQEYKSDEQVYNTFKLMLNQLLSFINDEDLKSEIKLEILLN